MDLSFLDEAGDTEHGESEAPAADRPLRESESMPCSTLTISDEESSISIQTEGSSPEEMRIGEEGDLFF